MYLESPHNSLKYNYRLYFVSRHENLSRMVKFDTRKIENFVLNYDYRDPCY